MIEDSRTQLTMADGQEEREEREKRRKQEEHEDRSDRINPHHHSEDDYQPERPDSRTSTTEFATLPLAA